MKIKKFVVSFLIAGFVSCIFAAGNDLDSVCNKLSAHAITTGDFVQTKTIASTGRSLKSSGNFIFSLEGIMWKTLKPFPSAMIVTDKAVIQVAADGKKTVIDVSDNEIFGSIAATLTGIFSNDVVQLRKNFNINFSDKGAGVWEMVLSPKDSTISSVMKFLTLSGKYSESSATIESLVMTEASENSIKYDFINQKYPKELTADEKANFNS